MHDLIKGGLDIKQFLNGVSGHEIRVYISFVILCSVACGSWRECGCGACSIHVLNFSCVDVSFFRVFGSGLCVVVGACAIKLWGAMMLT